MQKQYIGELVLSTEQIAEGVSIVANMLNQAFDEAVVITVVPGGIIYTADLVRQLDFDVSMDYMSCPHTPGDSTNASEIVYHQNVSIEGKDVIVIDDAIESGGTMKRLVKHLEQFSPKTISTATLFVKPSRVEIPVKQYYAFEMTNDDLLVGYGLPWKDQLRNVPYISKLAR
ncbi:phosphoribosyltransferase [Vibrio superstes]|uniref:Hypoxanthine phosphoribosyltransferase n=1 Tax=Vibrio superstes NBRC 103154 TaxID=1219062 RepID=A0A511QNZ8_9VIBR|nr:phosphoribosyltransferase family protein [Vibrio superstes]GEM79061.1 hypoxanthine phosphoribosyltransferase [Vibrio superstes NBRC 103154]